MIERLAHRLVTASLTLALSGTAALAIVGGGEDAGASSRASVMVLSSKGGVCSAVVLAPDVVLTAAHCVTGADEHRVHFRDGSGEPVLIVPAAKAVHPGYDAKAIEKRTRSIDLALVRLPQPLPARFESATLADLRPMKGDSISVGGYGLSRDGDERTTGTFRAADLSVIEPYGPSKILLWLQGKGAGACQGDSGGPMTAGDKVVAVTSWSAGTKASSCGGITQGILVGAQREWIDRIAGTWRRTPRWVVN
jgi:S1-C subfamily serine protease